MFSEAVEIKRSKQGNKIHLRLLVIGQVAAATFPGGQNSLARADNETIMKLSRKKNTADRISMEYPHAFPSPLEKISVNTLVLDEI